MISRSVPRLQRLVIACAVTVMVAAVGPPNAAATESGRGFVELELGRDSARVPLFVMPHPDPVATLVLLPGGDADVGRMVGGEPGSNNFLVRSRALFHAQGFNVVVAFRPTDLPTLDNRYRMTVEHVGELSRLVAYSAQRYGRPVWLVGTSRGSVSAAAAASMMEGVPLQGVVLTASVTHSNAGSVPALRLDRIKLPTLVVHHQDDACRGSRPDGAQMIFDDLKASPVKKLMLLRGGSDPVGDPCQARHWHGFINHEAATVSLITDWIKSPRD